MYCFDFFIKRKRILLPWRHKEQCSCECLSSHETRRRLFLAVKYSFRGNKTLHMCLRLLGCNVKWVYINHSARIFKVGNHWKDSNPSWSHHFANHFHHQWPQLYYFSPQKLLLNYKVLSFGRAADLLFLNWCILHCSLS